MVDFDSIEIDIIRKKRDELIQTVSDINKRYPGTDEESFLKAQKDVGNYKFNDDEVAKVLNIKVGRE